MSATARATKVRRAAVKTITVGSVALIVLALLYAATGWGLLNFVGPVAVSVVLLAFLVAAVAGACELGPKLAARHRTAVREARR